MIALGNTEVLTIFLCSNYDGYTKLGAVVVVLVVNCCINFPRLSSLRATKFL